jgi:1-acyl-sn-glycerol-3-phosphate acyltransferase
MPGLPKRLKPKRFALLRQPAHGDEALWTGIVWSRGRVLRRVRVIRRALLAILWSLVAMPVQVVLLLLPGPGKVILARVYWAGMCRLLGVKVRVIGMPAHRTGDGRPVVFISNHSSWLDVPVLGSQLEACFIAKEEIGRWPLVGQIAKLGRTVYVRRRRTSTARERDEMRARLAAGDGLILFPEGTTSDGSRVLPFRSTFLSVAELPANAEGRPPIVQPVSLVYDRLAFLPTGRASRPVFAWYGDMDFGTHFWRLVQHRGLRATVLLHTPLDPMAFPSRKALAQATWRAVADGAATLRQNRPARPLTVGDEAPEPVPAPAYAWPPRWYRLTGPHPDLRQCAAA